MNANQATGEFQQPGAYIERAVQSSNGVILDRVLDIMRRNPEPISESHMQLCRDITRYAVMEIPDTGDRFDNEAAHMRGLHWAWGIVDATRVMRKMPVHFAAPNPEPDMEPIARYELLKRGMKDFVYNSRNSCLLIESCAELVDPLEEYPRLTRRGLTMGLHMADLGIRAVRTNLTLRAIEAATDKEEFGEIMRASGFEVPEK